MNILILILILYPGYHLTSPYIIFLLTIMLSFDYVNM